MLYPVELRAQKPANTVVGVERFELPTLSSQTRCATRLRYTPPYSVKYPDTGVTGVRNGREEVPARQLLSTSSDDCTARAVRSRVLNFAAFRYKSDSMRLSFPNGEHADVRAGDGCIRIGSSADNDIVLAGLREHHARLTRDARGIVLEVVESGGRAHVNARPVREKAFVRYGDTLCLDSITLVIATMTPGDLETSDRPNPMEGPQRGVIRGVSGAWFGKSVEITDGLLISLGKGANAILGETVESTPALCFAVTPTGFMIHSKEPSGSLLNGHRCMATALRSGDQLIVGRDRFVVECNGTKSVAEEIDDADGDVETAEANNDQSRRSSSAVWWLIGAAALIGLILVVILMRGV